MSTAPIPPSVPRSAVAIQASRQDVIPEPAQTWHPLYLFNLYRLFLAGGFSLLVLFNNLPHPLGSLSPRLFAVTSLIYLVIAGVWAMTIRRRRPTFTLQIHLQVFTDIAVISVLMFASGGLISGVGMLLVVSVAGGALLAEGRTASLFAAMATIAIMAEEVYISLHLPFEKAILTQAGLYGIVLFLSAIVAHRLAAQLRHNVELARRRGADLANMAQTNSYIIRHIQAGIMVLDHADRVHVINSAAWKILGEPAAVERRQMRELSSPLADFLARWRQSGEEAADPVAIGERDILPRFTRLGSEQDSATLIFLEDTTLLGEQAQQARLASLGRLTASIAHEIRNPLGAISHAAQLMEEPGSSEAETARLLKIILDQSRRVNAVIENVLTLSRRNASHPQVLELKPLLEKCSRECLSSVVLDPERVNIEVEPADLRAYIDPSQLSQVLWNLCGNAVHQADKNGTNLQIRLEAHQDPNSPAVLLDVADNGPGIPQELEKKIFEPFFTTTQGGTGLGLYMSRELCESNRAELTLVADGQPGARFRIKIPDRGFLSTLASQQENP